MIKTMADVDHTEAAQADMLQASFEAVGISGHFF